MRSAGSKWAAVLCIGLATAAPSLAQPEASRADVEAYETFALARELAAAEEREAAEEQWRRGLELFAEEPYARLEYAQQLVRWGRVEGVAEEFLTAVELDPDNPDVLWPAGVFLRRQPDAVAGALDKSEELLLRLIEEVPSHDRAWLELGVLAMSRQDFRQAAERFERARDIAPFNLAAAGYLAEALLRSGDFDQAERVLTDLLAKDPAQLRARMALARIYADNEDVESAIEVLRAAPEEQAAEPTIARRLAFLLADASQVDEAVELTSQLLSESPGDLELRRLAVRLESAAGRYEDAANVLRPYVRATPEDVDAVIELAGYLEMLGLGAEAVEALELSRAALNSDTAAYRRATFYLLDLLGRRGDWSAVVEETTSLIGDGESPDWSVFPLHAEALYHVDGLRAARRFLDHVASSNAALEPGVRAKEAELLVVAGREDRAREVLAELAANGGSPGASLAAQVWSIRNRPQDALDFVEQAVRQSPENVEFRFQLASTFDAVGRWADAERELLAILDREADHAPTLNYLGYTWADRGDNLREALRLVRRAVDLNPGNGAYQDSLGWAYFQLGRYQEARPHLERAAALIPNDAVILEHLGDLYRAVGETGRARAFYRWAVRIGSDSPGLSGKLGDLSEDG